MTYDMSLDQPIMWETLSPPSYGTIVVDPPWQYNNTRGTQTRSTRGRRGVPAEGHYSTLTNANLLALPVHNLAAKDAHLYLWVTNPRMFRAHGDNEVGPIDLVEAWGFQYITVITWVKTGPLGLGFYYRGQTEHVIFATRGKAPIPADRRVKNVIHAPQRGHCWATSSNKFRPGPTSNCSPANLVSAGTRGATATKRRRWSSMAASRSRRQTSDPHPRHRPRQRRVRLRHR